jgi:hypothetical protein
MRPTSIVSSRYSSGVAGLQHEPVLGAWEDRLHQVRTAAVEGVLRELLRRRVPVAVVVVDPYDRHVLLARAVDQTGDLRQRGAHAFGQPVRVLVVVRVEHVDHQQGGLLAACGVLRQLGVLTLGALAFLQLLAQIVRPLRAACVRLGVLLGLRLPRAAFLLGFLQLLLGAQVLGFAQVSASSSR